MLNLRQSPFFHLETPKVELNQSTSTYFNILTNPDNMASSMVHGLAFRRITWQALSKGHSISSTWDVFDSSVHEQGDVLGRSMLESCGRVRPLCAWTVWTYWIIVCLSPGDMMESYEPSSVTSKIIWNICRNVILTLCILITKRRVREKVPIFLLCNWMTCEHCGSIPLSDRLYSYFYLCNIFLLCNLHILY